MRLVANGEPFEAPEGTTVADLLERLGLAGRPVAVQRNDEVVPRAEHATTVLREGDRIEVLRFVGGGAGPRPTRRGRKAPSRAAVLEALVETQRAFRAATDVEEILEATLAGVGRVAPVETAHVLLAEEGRLVVRASRGRGAGASFDVGDAESLAARAFRDGARVAGEAAAERAAGLVRGPAEALPLAGGAGGRVHGVLLLEPAGAGEAATLLAEAAGQALDTATLYRDLVESLFQISLLAEASRRMQEAEGEPESIVARAVSPVAARLGLPLLALYDGEGRRLGGVGGPAVLGRGALEALEAGPPRVVERAPAEWGPLAGRAVAAAVVRRPPLRGLLVAASDRPDDLPPARLDLLAALADRLGLAVQEARLVSDLRAHSVAVEYLNRELARTIEDLRRSSELKSRFVSTVSHELRTPLASIRLHAETILDALEDLDRERIREFVTVIGQEAERLSRLIGDVLDLSRLLAGRRPLLRSPVDLGEVAERVAETLRPIARSRGVAIETEAEGDLVVSADRDAAIQALTNVVANAVKYSRSGGLVRVRGRSTEDGVRVSVSDTGEGISPEHLPHVFEEFYKVDATGSEEGTGLGLAITKAILEGHGGGIDVESEVGRGSTFTLRFPRA